MAKYKKPYNWQLGHTYEFLPSGDAEVIRIKILSVAKPGEAESWYRSQYSRSQLDQSPPLTGKAYKATIVRGGQDADITHRRGDVYYIWESEEPYTGIFSHYEF